MIIVDNMLEELHKKGRPIGVGLVGVGFMGRGIAQQIIRATRGIELRAVYNRHPDNIPPWLKKKVRVIDDAMTLCRRPDIDVVVEATGTIEFASRVVRLAIAEHKDVVVMNAELDGTVGPILKARADEEGVTYTNVGGDEPGVMMDLYRWVRGFGLDIRLCGNIKTFYDPHRNPDDMRQFAVKYKQRPHMLASFTDGTKMSFEQAIMANAIGGKVGQRGMYGPAVTPGTPIMEAAQQCFADLLPAEGPPLVDYIIGAAPAAGVFVMATCHDHKQRHYLEYYKMGPGPTYTFYSPHHLCHFDVPSTIARAAVLGDAVLAPKGPFVDVVTVAKRDLRAGEVLDRIGGYMTYGLCENSDVVSYNRLLPIGLAEDCTLRRDVPIDEVLTYDDVEVPTNRLVDKLRQHQDERFFP